MAETIGMMKKIGKTITFQIINKKPQQKVEVKNVTQKYSGSEFLSVIGDMHSKKYS